MSDLEAEVTHYDFNTPLTDEMLQAAVSKNLADPDFTLQDAKEASHNTRQATQNNTLLNTPQGMQLQESENKKTLRKIAKFRNRIKRAIKAGDKNKAKRLRQQRWMLFNQTATNRLKERLSDGNPELIKDIRILHKGAIVPILRLDAKQMQRLQQLRQADAQQLSLSDKRFLTTVKQMEAAARLEIQKRKQKLVAPEVKRNTEAKGMYLPAEETLQAQLAQQQKTEKLAKAKERQGQSLQEQQRSIDIDG